MTQAFSCAPLISIVGKWPILDGMGRDACDAESRDISCAAAIGKYLKNGQVLIAGVTGTQ